MAGDGDTMGDGIRRGTARRWMAVALVALVALVAVAIGYVALGKPGLRGGGAGDATAGMADASMAISVEQFAERAAAPGAFLVNVHTPNEGSIDGTDLAVPSELIGGDARLPQDRATPILLYCKTGRMSRDAARTLMGRGYSNVAYLDGGMNAWVASGRPLS